MNFIFNCLIVNYNKLTREVFNNLRVVNYCILPLSPPLPTTFLAPLHCCRDSGKELKTVKRLKYIFVLLKRRTLHRSGSVGKVIWRESDMSSSP